MSPRMLTTACQTVVSASCSNNGPVHDEPYLIALWHDEGDPEQRPEQDEQQDDRDPSSR